MAIINLVSTHPNLSMIIGKNPNTGLKILKKTLKYLLLHGLHLIISSHLEFIHLNIKHQKEFL